MVLAFVFIYHGLIPKVLWLDEIEILITEAHNFGIETATIALVTGFLEIALGFAILVFQSVIWPIYLAAIILILLFLDIAIMAPQFLTSAFNVVTLNLLGLFVCTIILATQKERDLSLLK